MKGYLDLGELPSTSTILNTMNTENNYIVYALQSPNGKLYVGQTKKYKERMEHHKSKDSGCVAISRAIQKHGWENIKEFVLMEGLSLEQANYFEEHYIDIFDCIAPNGYNLRTGGENYEVSQITKDRMSATARAKGDNHQTKRPEVRAKLTAAREREWQDKEYRARMTAASVGNTYALGSVRTAEIRAKMSSVAKEKHNRHETRMLHSLTTQLYWHEKRLEKEGLL